MMSERNEREIKNLSEQNIAILAEITFRSATDVSVLEYQASTAIYGGPEDVEDAYNNYASRYAQRIALISVAILVAVLASIFTLG